MADNSSGSERTYYLKQQSPMLHFQHAGPHVTLRATELKPKLDRFIEEWMRRDQKVIPDEWRMKKDLKKTSESDSTDEEALKKNALNYRIRIINREGSEVIDDNRDDKKSPYKRIPYFGNMGDNSQNKLLVTAKRFIELHIRCYIRELLSIIDECLPTFFLTVNFGTRQDKGFGSFLLCKDDKGTPYDRKENEAMLASWNSTRKIYCIRYKRPADALEILSDIDILYKLLKSGINFNGVYLKSYLMLYFKAKGVDWDKKALKHHRIAPNVYSDPSHAPTDSRADEKFVRGLLGVGDVHQWFSADKNGGKLTKPNKNGEMKAKKEKIFTSSKDPEIKRVPSPLTFKIVENVIYILIEDIDPRVMGSWFIFTNESGGEYDLQIPSAGEFSLDEIMAGFRNYINSGKVRGEFSKWAPKNNSRNKTDRRPVFIQQVCQMDVFGGKP